MFILNKKITTITKKRLYYSTAIIAFVFCLSALQGCYEESSVPINASFTSEFVDGDESVPVIVRIQNQTEGAETYNWEFEGGIPAASTDKNPPEILYDTPGTYTIRLTARNSDGEESTHSITVIIREGININFSTAIIASNYPPVELQITNTTNGVGLVYNWQFEGGTPARFEGQHPPNIIFQDPGDHTISLTVSNAFESFTETSVITVAPHLVASYVWAPDPEDIDYEAPVVLNFTNQSISATNYVWNFPGGNPNTSTDVNPTVVFANAGTYQVSLTALNDKTSQTVNQTITISSNTNLYTLTNIHLGINAAHNSNAIGAFYSIAARRTYKANEVNATNSGLIDIAFQGLNSNFTYNKFISPDAVQQFGFPELANAQHTVFVNSQELCGCGLNFTVAQFDAMENDTPLQPLQITSTAGGSQQFGAALPRIVLFRTQDGRKGAIKVKQMVQNGTGSYIVCDIKVQKQP